MAHAAPSIIRNEHRSLTAVLRSLQRLAHDAARGDVEPDFDLLAIILDYIEVFPDRLHHPKEDEHLFRALRQRLGGAGGASEALDELAAEHHRTDELTRGLRRHLLRARVGGRAARALLAAAVDEYADFHWKHMRKEEDVVMPLAEALLTEADWQAIDAAFLAHDDPLFGPEPRQEFERLFRLILNRAPAPVGVGPAWRPTPP